MSHTCKRCGAEFAYRSRLVYHLSMKKKVCPPLHTDISVKDYLDELNQIQAKKRTYTCKHCCKGFTNPQSKYVHQKACQGGKERKVDEELASTVASLKAELAELKAHTLAATSNIQTNTQNNITITVNNSGQVKLREFGCENMESLPEDLIGGLFLDLRFRDLLENLHCAPDYPENQNVRIKSTKREVMEIYRNNKWDVMTFMTGLNELLLQGHRIFKDYYRKNKEKILDEDMEEEDLMMILDKLDAIERLREEDVQPMRKDIQLMLESYRGQLQKV
jgi:hypothetical protein